MIFDRQHMKKVFFAGLFLNSSFNEIATVEVILQHDKMVNMSMPIIENTNANGFLHR